ncbi:hypothetical protein SAMN06265219_101256 [Gracilimonas mengyeensis]|uniref:Uncharacterized protein n=1 Tax=Gracilimonas mengyeensis TaxID=1302730 RepID=A0A521AMZ8_9BACT|nr:hypothetical protein SAMN06265219_101256 [Gracilimonas mengyeensis]
MKEFSSIIDLSGFKNLTGLDVSCHSSDGHEAVKRSLSINYLLFHLTASRMFRAQNYRTEPSDGCIGQTSKKLIRRSWSLQTTSETLAVGVDSVLNFSTWFKRPAWTKNWNTSNLRALNALAVK